MYNSQRAHGVWYGLKEYVRTFQFVQNPIGRLVHCTLYIVHCTLSYTEFASAVLLVIETVFFE